MTTQTIRTFIPAVTLAGLVAFFVVNAFSQTKDFVKAGEEFVDLLAKQQFAQAVTRYDSAMKAALPEDKLQGTWEAIQKQIGPFQKRLGTKSQRVQGYEVVLVTCEFEKSALDTKVVFDTQGRVAGLFFVPAQPPQQVFSAPAYVKTNDFTEKQLQVGDGKWALPATLSLPNGPGPWPVVVLVHGSGPQDRDETIGANKPFRDLAWGLASQGVAALRYEKRTKAHASELAGIASRITLQEETIEDAVTAARRVRAMEGIDPKRVFVLGHSLGGLAAPRIGKADSQIAGLVILAGSTRPLEDLVVEQTRYLASLEGKLSPAEESKVADLEGLMKKVKQLTPADAGSSELIFGAGAAYWLDLHSYDPVATARDLQQPILILQGARDYQVTEADFAGWKKGLAGDSRVTFKYYQDLNHLFITGSGKSRPTEYEQPGHVAGVVVSDIANWVKR
jgi:uncharacterized protein